MAIPVVMPKISMGQTEGSVSEWLVNDGDHIEKGEALMTMETEKVQYDCESPASGIIIIELQPEVVVPVESTIAQLAESQEEYKAIKSGRKVSKVSEKPAMQVSEPEVTVPSHQSVTEQKRILISPLAKKLAKDDGVDISAIKGTGPGNKIIKRDIDEYINAKNKTSESARRPDPKEGSSMVVKHTIPFSGKRKTIAKRLQESLATTAQLSITGEVDMSDIVKFRNRLLEQETKLGTRITFTDLFIKTVATAVKAVPIVNSSLDGEEIKIWENVNIGLAVAVELNEYESSLVIPVIHDANKKTLSQISMVSKELASRARKNTLTSDEVREGTITISSIGSIAKGWTTTTPIINSPQSVIIQPGTIEERPMVREGQVEIRPMMTISYTFDHRVLDGVPILKFHNRISELLSNLGLNFLEI